MKNILRWTTAGVLYLSVVFFFLPYINADIFMIDESVSGWNLLQFSIENTEELIRIFMFFVLPVLMTLVAAILITIKSSKIIYAGAMALCFSSLLINASLIFAGDTFLEFDVLEAIGIGLILNTVAAAIGMGLSVYNLFADTPVVVKKDFVNPVYEPFYANPTNIVASGTIVGINGMYKDQSFKIENGEELVLGRDGMFAHIIINIDSEKISRKHCTVRYDGVNNCYQVTDYSTNGTFTDPGTRLVANVTTSLPRSTVIKLGNNQNQFMLN